LPSRPAPVGRRPDSSGVGAEPVGDLVTGHV